MTIFGRHQNILQRTKGPEITVCKTGCSKSTWKKFGITFSTAAIFMGSNACKMLIEQFVTFSYKFVLSE